MFEWKNGTRRAVGSPVSVGLGANVPISNPPFLNVTCTDGGRWYRGDTTGRKSRTFRRIGHRSPCHPTTSSGWNGYVSLVKSSPRITRTSNSPFSSWGAGGVAQVVRQRLRALAYEQTHILVRRYRRPMSGGQIGQVERPRLHGSFDL